MITDEELTKSGATLNDTTQLDSPDEGISPGNSKGARRSMLWLQGAAFLLGFALLVYVINRVGVQPIFDALKRIGYGFFILLLISGARHALRALAMSRAVAPEHRRFNFFQALSARLGGEAISFLTFTGPLLGEATKVALLSKRVPLVYGVSALVIDNLLYNFSVAILILSGACVMLASYRLPAVVSYALITIAVSAGLTIAAVVFAASRRVMPLTWSMERFARLRVGRKLFLKRGEQVNRLEKDVYDFYKHRRASFFAMLGFDFLSHATSVAEVYVTLRMLGFRPGFEASMVIESLTKVINFVFGFVPATIGVYEGGTGVILYTLGYAAAAGLTLAFVRKAGTVFWTGIGTVILIWRGVPNAARHLTKKSPRLQKLMDSLVLSNIAHRPARTLVSVFGIALGVLLIVFTVGLAHGILRERGRRDSNLNAEIRVSAAGSIGLIGSQPFALPLSRIEEIAKLEGVRAAVPLGQTFDKSETGFGSRLIDGINFDEYTKIGALNLTEGTALPDAGDVAIVDTTWQKEHNNAHAGSSVTLYERPFRVVGVYEPPSGARIKIPLRTMQEQLSGENHCTAVLVACQNPAQQEQVAARIKERFPDDQIIFTRDLQELYASGVPALNIFINVVVAVASSISTLVILLAMYTTVTERTRQIGILKSLGMSKLSIAWVIEQEAILVSVMGVAAGLLLTLLARFALMRSTSLRVELEPKWMAVALGVGLAGGTIGALYPAWRAARADAVDALSYE
ncbi:MAG: ABC transporter permease [Pyrinomonadaceae bacterium]